MINIHSLPKLDKSIGLSACHFTMKIEKLIERI